MTDAMEQAKETFSAECEELLHAMEDSLLQLESDPSDAEAVAAIFRAAHTIKGTSGVFGYDTVVSFTHVVENLLDKVRAGEIAIDRELVELLLACSDQMSTLVESAITEQPLDADTLERGEKLVEGLHRYLGEDGKTVAAVGHRLIDETDNLAEHDCWHISLRFGPDILKDGMDPMSLLHYLETLGEIVNVVTVIDQFPPAAEMDPESCHMGLEINFRSGIDKATIESAFDFIRGSSVVRILPPGSRVQEYIEIIKNLPDDGPMLGDFLVRSGVITARELAEGLSIQFHHEKDGLHGVGKQPLGEILVEEKMIQPEIVSGAIARQKAVREHKTSEHNLIRVHADKLDLLIDSVGELVIAGAGANMLARRDGLGNMIEATSVISRLVEKIRDNALQLRMVQIGETFARFQRVVHDTGRELGKDIELLISGSEAELDKSVVEKLGDPLMHLVRNALDHGIEAPEIRISQGKPARGSLRLNAYHESGSIAIEISDDGAGMNREKILNKALERDLISLNQTLTDSEIFGLIFEPGFSTADKVSNISGRGVGLDVVKRNITALRGSVEVESREGIGSTFRIRLPLTLAIIDGFLVGVGKSSYVIPLNTVVECVELSEKNRAESVEQQYINLRGEVLPFIRLREQFELAGSSGKRENIVVVQHGGQKIGLVVDELLGEFQTVIKPLCSLFKHIRGIGGSTILGTGDVALILDVQSLLAFASAQHSQ